MTHSSTTLLRVAACAAALWVTGTSIPAAAATLEGVTRDAVTGSPLPLASVALPDVRLGGLSAEDGTYVVVGVPGGRHAVRYSHIGYGTRIDTVEVSAEGVTRWDASLQPESITLSRETVVTADRARTERRVQSGYVTLEPRQLKTAPAVGEGDLLRTLQLLPGVQSASDISSGLYVRGGGPDQTLILLDGAPLYNPSHAFGFFSTFSPEIVEDVSLYKSAYPASNSGNLGGLLEVSHRDGNPQEVAFSGGVSLIAARLAAEGPVGNGSWVVSGRRTYLDPVLDAVRSTGADVPGYYFYDVSGKLTQRVGSAGNLAVTVYSGRDDLTFDGDADTFFGIRWGNDSVSANWSHVLSPVLVGTVSASLSRYESTTSASFFDTPVLLRNSIDDVTARAGVEYFLTEDHSLSVGTQLTGYRMRYREEFNQDRQRDLDESPYLTSLFVQDDWLLASQTQVRVGVRASYFSEGGRWAVMPRLSVSQALSPTVRLKAGGGSYRQYLQLVSTEGFSGGDFWVPLDQSVQPARAEHAVLGLEWEPSRDYRLSVETYYADMDELVTLDNFRAVDQSGARSQDLFFAGGRGRATGLELFAEKRTGQLTGWLGYTLGRTERAFPELNGGRDFAPKFDRRHDLSLAASYRAGPWTWGSNFVYATGQAFTPASARYTLRSPATGEVEDFVLPAERNSARLLPYHRLDVSLRRGVSLWGSDAEIYLQIVNLYNRRNEWFVQYDVDDPDTEPKVVQQLPLIPTFGIDFRF
ncbi:TonB-dependent receptor plug domain-containing protein [Candidatus Latescibacterota bacterium]